MPDIKSVAESAVTPFAASMPAAKLVNDAWKLVVPVDEEYIESEVVLEHLDFSSTVRSGLAVAVTPPTDGAVRASTTVTLPLTDTSGGTGAATRDVTLNGPGDVRGIEPNQVVRRHPAPNTQTSESVMLAHIEFDRPELPWAFSVPDSAGALRPWLVLVVVPANACVWEPIGAGGLPVLQVSGAELPDLANSARWAHAQAAGTTGAATLATRLSPAHAPTNLSRLVAPRALAPGQTYAAVLVPATNIGVQAGLGLTGGTLDDAWAAGAAATVRLPAYDHWEFRTGPKGSFRELALRLEGAASPWEVGRRIVDTSTPGQPMKLTDTPGARQVVRCALVSPSKPTADQSALNAAAWPAPLTNELRAELNRAGEIRAAAAPTGVASPDDDLPIVGPRMYGQLHRGAAAVGGSQNSDWFDELNLHPTDRMVAGLGTRVVQKEQEPMMQAAWAQAGAIYEANRAVALAQVAEELSRRMFRRFESLMPSYLLRVCAPAAERLITTPDATLAARVGSCATPMSTMGGAFRRTTRVGGPALRRSGIADRANLSMLTAVGEGFRDFTRENRNPNGVSFTSEAALGDLNFNLVAMAMNNDVEQGGPGKEAVISPDQAERTVKGAAGQLESGGVVSEISDPSSWGPGIEDIGAEKLSLERWERQLDRSVAPEFAEMREQRVAPLMASISLAERPIDSDAFGRVRTGALRSHNRIAVDGEPPVIDPHRGRGPRIREFNPRVLTPLEPDPTPTEETKALTHLATLSHVKLGPMLDVASGLTVTDLRDMLPDLADASGVLGLPAVPRRPVLDIGAADLLGQISPERTVRGALRGRLDLPVHLSTSWIDALTDSLPIPPIMAAPRFDVPMYRALDAYDREWLVPGMRLLPGSDFVTVLSTNDEFIEAFMVGLSDEFGRELLWRGFPTDRRGTYFHRFWNHARDELTRPIHAFSRKPLGTHVDLGSGAGQGDRAVIVVKSELVRRYPDVIIQAVRNQGTEAAPVFESPTKPQQTAPLLFSEHLEPDIALVGIDLTVEELRKPEWWIVIAEHPSAAQFDRPADTNGSITLPQPTSAAAAQDLLHQPTRVAFKATDLID